jgi:MgtE intracellular N domain
VGDQTVTVSDPAVIAQIQTAAAAGDWATVATLVGPLVMAAPGPLGQSLFDAGQLSSPVLTQEFGGASGTAGTDGQDYTVSFDTYYDPPADSADRGWSVHADVTLDFTAPAAATGATVGLADGRALTVDYGAVAFTAAERAALAEFDWAGAGGSSLTYFEGKLRAGLGDALVDKLQSISVTAGGADGMTGLINSVAPAHSSGPSPHGWLGIDGAGIGADVQAVVAKAPNAAEADIDGQISGAAPGDILRDSRAEAAFTLGQGLLSATGGAVPSDWTEADYVAFALGFNGLGNLTGTAAWDSFVATNLPPGAPPKPVAEMDLSMFAPYFPQGTGALTTPIEDGLALHDTITSMRAQGVTSFSSDTFEAAYNSADGGGRRLTAAVANPDHLTAEQISFAQTEASADVTGKGKFAADVGETAAEEVVESGVEGVVEGVAIDVGLMIPGGAELLALGVVVGMGDKTEEEISEAMAAEAVENVEGYVTPLSQIGVGTKAPTYRRKYEAGYLSASVQTLLGQGDAAGAAALLRTSEASGTHAPVLEAALANLSDGDRAKVEAALVAGVGGTSYYEALQKGRSYSALEDQAFGKDPALTTGFAGLVAQDPADGSGSSPSGYVIAQRLQDLPPKAAVELIQTWSQVLLDNPDYSSNRLNDAMATLSQQAPDLLLAAASAIDTADPVIFGQLVKTLVDDGHADGAAALLQGLSTPKQAAILAKAGVMNLAQLQAAFTQPDSLAGKILAVLPTKGKADLAAYLDGVGTARTNVTAFTALTTPAERAAFLTTLKAPATLTAGSTPEAAVSAAQAVLLAQLSPKEAAQVIAERFYPTDGSTAPADAGKALTDLLKLIGPDLASKTVKEITLELTRRGQVPVDPFDDSSPIKQAIQAYLSGEDSGPLADTAAFIAELTPQQAATILAAMEPGQAAYALQMLVDQGKTTEAGAITEALATTSPATAAAILQTMDYGPAAQLLATLDPAMAKSILAEMPDDAAAAILAKMEPEAAVNIFQQTSGDEDYSKMLGILMLMGDSDSAAAVAEDGIPGLDQVGAGPDTPDPFVDDALTGRQGSPNELTDYQRTPSVINVNDREYAENTINLGDNILLIEAQVEIPTQETNLSAGNRLLTVGQFNGQEVLVPVILDPTSADGYRIQEGYIVRPDPPVEGSDQPQRFRTVRIPNGMLATTTTELNHAGIVQGDDGDTLEDLRDSIASERAGQAGAFSGDLDFSTLPTVPSVPDSGPNALATLRWILTGASASATPEASEWAQQIIVSLDLLSMAELGQLTAPERVFISELAAMYSITPSSRALLFLANRQGSDRLDSQTYFGNQPITEHLDEQVDRIVDALATNVPDLGQTNLGIDDLDGDGADMDIHVLVQDIVETVAAVYGIAVPEVRFSSFAESGLNPDAVAMARPGTNSEAGTIEINVDTLRNEIEDGTLPDRIVHEITHLYQRVMMIDPGPHVVGTFESQMRGILRMENYFVNQDNTRYMRYYPTLWTESHAFYMGTAVDRGIRERFNLPRQPHTDGPSDPAGRDVAPTDLNPPYGSATLPPAGTGDWDGEENSSTQPPKRQKTDGST